MSFKVYYQLFEQERFPVLNFGWSDRRHWEGPIDRDYYQRVLPPPTNDVARSSE
jgi:hypothetical protein